MTTLADYRSHIAKSLLENRVKLCDLWQQEVQGVAARNDFDVGPGDFQLDDLASIIEQISLILVNPDEPPSQADSIIERKASALGYLRFAQNRHVTELLNELNFMASLLEQAIVDATVEWDGRIELHEALHILCITSDSMRNIKHSAMTAYAQQTVEGEELFRLPC